MPEQIRVSAIEIMPAKEHTALDQKFTDGFNPKKKRSKLIRLTNSS
jgi:hypothetical protein